MDFQELQAGAIANVIRYSKKYDLTIDEDYALIKLYEEVGEFSQAVLIHRKKSKPSKHLSEEDSKKEIAKELADVVGMAMLNAHLLGIDIEEALKVKWLKLPPSTN